MKYYHKLYTDDELCLKWKEVQIKLKHDELLLNTYLIALTQNEANHLEFFDAVYVQKKMMNSEDLFVIGMAEGYKGAVSVVQKILQEVLCKTGGTNIRGYLLAQQRQYEESNEKV